MTFKEEMGQRLANLRVSHKLSRSRLAELSGLSSKFIYDVEVGNKGITSEKLRPLANALNASCDYLITGKQLSENADIEEITTMLARCSTGELDYIKSALQAFLQFRRNPNEA